MTEVTSKLHKLTGDITNWSSNIFDHVRKEIRQLTERLADLRDDTHRTGPT
jgi:hypothetical protein